MDRILIAKLSAIFAGGAGFGTVITYFVMRTKYEKLITLEIESVKAAYHDRVASLEETVTELAESPPEGQDALFEADAEVITAQETTNKIIVTNSYIPKSSIDMEALRDAIPRPTAVPTDEELTEAYAGPFIITAEQYLEECDTYDKATLSYFTLDDTLADEGEEVVTDVSKLIGDDALTEFTEKVQTVYVRNDLISTDFEINKEEASYAKVVLGINEEEKPRVRRMRATYDR